MKIKINRDTYIVKAVSPDKKKMNNPESNTYNMGLSEFDKQPTISIRKGMSESVTRSTVIHELVHAYIFSYGYNVESEESMCDFFGSMGDEIIKVADEVMKGVFGSAFS